MLYIFHGEDTYSLSQATALIEDSFAQGLSGDNNVIRLDLKEDSFDQLQTLVATVPFWGENRLVILRNLFEKFDSKVLAKVSSRVENVTSTANQIQRLKDLLIATPEFTTVIIESDFPQLGSPLFDDLASVAEVRYFAKLSEGNLQRWVVGYVTDRGGNITAEATSVLCHMVGVDLWRLSSELEKLLLFCQDSTIDAASIKKAVVFARDINIFAILDAFFEKDQFKAIRLFDGLLGSGTNLSYVLSMISRQVRLLLLAKETHILNLGLGQARVYLGTKSDFVLKKTLKQASKYSVHDLIAFYKKLRDFDRAVKTGKCEPGLGLNIIFGESITSQVMSD